MSEKRRYVITGDEGEEQIWEVETLEEGLYRVWRPDGAVVEVDAYSPSAGALNLLLAKRSVEISFVEEEDATAIHVAGEKHRVSVLNERQHRMRAAGVGRMQGESPELMSPMAGKVVQVCVEVGQRVELGERAVVVEAMKMENDLKAHREGVVTAVVVEEGQAVEIGDVLVVIGGDE